MVAFLPDTGMRYLSKVYSDEWMRERGYTDSEVPLTAEDVVAAKHRSGKVREMILVGPYQTVFHALRTMQEQDISQLPVFEETNIVGTIYEDQILNLALQGKDLRKLVHPRSDEQAAAASAMRRARRARHLSAEP